MKVPFDTSPHRSSVSEGWVPTPKVPTPWKSFYNSSCQHVSPHSLPRERTRVPHTVAKLILPPSLSFKLRTCTLYPRHNTVRLRLRLCCFARCFLFLSFLNFFIYFSFCRDQKNPNACRISRCPFCDIKSSRNPKKIYKLYYFQREEAKRKKAKGEGLL